MMKKKTIAGHSEKILFYAKYNILLVKFIILKSGGKSYSPLHLVYY